MRTKMIVPVSILVLGAASTQMLAQDLKVCQKISGSASETILPKEVAPNDPFGRILGSFTGSFAGVSNVPYTAILTSPPVFSAAGFPSVQTPIAVREAYVTGPGDSITFTGSSIFNLAPASLPGDTASASPVSRCPGTPCVVQIPKDMVVTGGTGRWAGASGLLRGVGLGNLNLPQGQGTFIFSLDGEVCVSAGSVAFSQPVDKR